MNIKRAAGRAGGRWAAPGGASSIFICTGGELHDGGGGRDTGVLVGQTRDRDGHEGVGGDPGAGRVGPRRAQGEAVVLSFPRLAGTLQPLQFVDASLGGNPDGTSQGAYAYVLRGESVGIPKTPVHSEQTPSPVWPAGSLNPGRFF